MTHLLREDVKSAYELMARKIIGIKHVVSKLESKLRDTEKVRLLASAVYGNGGLLTLTDQRLVFVSYGSGNKNLIEIELPRIILVDYIPGIYLSKIKVCVSGKQYNFSLVGKSDALKFVNTIHQELKTKE